MKAILAWVMVALICVSNALPSARTYVDLLDASDVGGPPPQGIVVVDVYATVSTYAWGAGGIRADALNGARLLYADDPNSDSGLLVNPGPTGQFVTSLSRPYARDAIRRLTDARVYPNGRYSPPGDLAVATPDQLNVNFEASPPPTGGSPIVNGYTCRVAIDITQVSVPGGPFPDSAFVLFEIGEQPAGFIPVLLSQGVGADTGTVNAELGEGGVPFGVNWGIYVPEPATAWLAGLIAIWIRRSRS